MWSRRVIVFIFEVISNPEKLSTIHVKFRNLTEWLEIGGSNGKKWGQIEY